MQQWSEKYFKKVFFNLYLPFNIAIAAVSPIEEHSSVAWNYTGLHEPLDYPASEIIECHNSSLSMALGKSKPLKSEGQSKTRGRAKKQRIEIGP